MTSYIDEWGNLNCPIEEIINGPEWSPNREKRKMRLRSIITSLYESNIGLTRPLLESVVVPEITEALKTWIQNASVPGVLIGGASIIFLWKT